MYFVVFSMWFLRCKFDLRPFFVSFVFVYQNVVGFPGTSLSCVRYCFYEADRPWEDFMVALFSLSIL